MLTLVALTYVDIDEDNDSLDVALDTPPVSAHSHKMPRVEMAKPAESAGDVVSPVQEEEKPLPGRLPWKPPKYGV